VTRSFTRRAFLRVALMSGAAVGCSPTLTPPPVKTAGPASGTRFRLEGDSVTYQPHPRGCEQTTIRGSARAADGSPQPGLSIRVWEEDPAQAIVIVTDAEGNYAYDVSAGLTDKTFRVQVLDSAGAPISDVIVAAAIPDCAFNSMTVNFVAGP